MLFRSSCPSPQPRSPWPRGGRGGRAAAAHVAKELHGATFGMKSQSMAGLSMGHQRQIRAPGSRLWGAIISDCGTTRLSAVVFLFSDCGFKGIHDRQDSWTAAQKTRRAVSHSLGNGTPTKRKVHAGPSCVPRLPVRQPRRARRSGPRAGRPHRLCRHLAGAALSRSPLLGPIFESFVLSERRKRHHTTLIRPNLMFYRDDSKIEVDLADATDTSQSLLCEIRSGQTYRGSFTRNLRTVGRMPGLENATH